jgi:hypothetical protein
MVTVTCSRQMAHAAVFGLLIAAGEITLGILLLLEVGQRPSAGPGPRLPPAAHAVRLRHLGVVPTRAVTRPPPSLHQIPATAV